MQIRVGVAVKDKALSKTLVKAILTYSLASSSKAADNETFMDVETDIAFFDGFSPEILKSYSNLDLAFFDYAFLSETTNSLWELARTNLACMPVLVSIPENELGDFLTIRPMACVTKRNLQEQVDALCAFCADYVRTSNQVLQLKTKKGFLAISISSILYCQSDLKYVVVVTTQGQLHRKLGKLDDIARRLPPGFIRIHQSFLVNSAHVAGVDKTAWEIILSQGERLPVSKKYRSSIETHLQNCCFNA